jgi:hypothetical protein
MMQILCELVPFKWYLTFKHKELDATSVEHLFDLEIAPELDMITPNLLAYFDYLFWFITQPNGSKSGPEDDIM